MLHDVLEILMLATAAGWAVATVLSLVDQFLYGALPAGPVARDPEAAPRVSVLIPARNEEHNIEGCVLSVLNQTYPAIEVIVVDDQSTDRTPELLEEMAAGHSRLRVLRGRDLPEGWIGKGWALWQAHQEADGDWIVLLDADVRLEPWALDRAIEKAERDQIDLLNPWPRFVNLGFWERVMQPLLWGLVRLRFPLVWVNQAWSPENMAFGPMMVLRKEAYDAIGGHRPVATDILEDVALAKHMRKRGYRTRVVNGKRLFRIRMYRNLQELLDGWTKTAFGAMSYSLPMMLVAVVGLFWAATQPFVTLAWALIVGHATYASLAGLQVLALLVRRWADARENDFPTISILLHPLGILLVHYMQLRAVWKYYFGSYHWKGRDYHKPKPAQLG